MSDIKEPRTAFIIDASRPISEIIDLIKRCEKVGIDYITIKPSSDNFNMDEISKIIKILQDNSTYKFSIFRKKGFINISKKEE